MTVVPMAETRIGVTLLNDRERVDVVIEQHGGDRWFYGWVENMFDPTRFLVRADTFFEAWENLLCDPLVERDCAITEADDYDPECDGTYNDNGVWLDTEAVKLSECTVRLVRQADDDVLADGPPRWRS